MGERVCFVYNQRRHSLSWQGRGKLLTTLHQQAGSGEMNVGA